MLHHSLLLWYVGKTLVLNAQSLIVPFGILFFSGSLKEDLKDSRDFSTINYACDICSGIFIGCGDPDGLSSQAKYTIYFIITHFYTRQNISREENGLQPTSLFK